MKKLLIAAAALALAAGLVATALGVYLVRKLSPAELEKAILEQARATLGTELRVQRMDVSLLSGVTLEGIAVRNPAPFPGDLLTADAFVLRYRLLPLLAGRVEVERLALEKPALTALMDARGGFNYEKLGGGTAAKAAPGAPAAAVPLRIVMKSLAVEGGSVVMKDAAKALLLSASDIGLRSAFEVTGGGAQGEGGVSVGSVSLADVLFVRGAKGSLTMSKAALSLTPIRGQVAGGTLTGGVLVVLEPFHYTADLAVDGANVTTLLAEAKSAAAFSGNLSGKARFEGRGGLPTIRGTGSADVSSCRAEGSRVLALLAGVLQVPELANPDFEACHVEFQQTGSRFATPVVNLKGDALRLTGGGTLDLDSSGLDYRMTLALSPRLFAKITRPELRGAFETREAGFAAIDFRLYGTTLEPKTDLLSRLGKAAATEAAKQGVNRLFKRKVF